jgi:hypothetical protein
MPGTLGARAGEPAAKLPGRHVSLPTPYGYTLRAVLLDELQRRGLVAGEVVWTGSPLRHERPVQRTTESSERSGREPFGPDGRNTQAHLIPMIAYVADSDKWQEIATDAVCRIRRAG